MRPSRVSGRAHRRDRLTSCHAVADLNEQLRSVRVERATTVGMLEHYHISVALVAAREYDLPGRGGADRQAAGRGDVDAFVKSVAAIDRIATRPEERSQWALNRRMDRDARNSAQRFSSI